MTRRVGGIISHCFDSSRPLWETDASWLLSIILLTSEAKKRSDMPLELATTPPPSRLPVAKGVRASLIVVIGPANIANPIMLGRVVQ